jgi:hypothetical protein
MLLPTNQGIEPAPQSAHAREIERLTVDWLN